ncbi:hypothetical protein [Streptomyces sp. NPDC004763]
MRKIRLSAGVAAVVFAAGLLSACGGGDGESSTSAASTAASASEGGAPVEDAKSESSKPADVKIVKAGYEDHEVWGDNAYVVYWELTNTGDKAGNFYAGLDFLDKDGDVLGSTGITADKVGPGKTAKGNASPLDVEIDKGEMSDIKDVRVTDIERMDF